MAAVRHLGFVKFKLTVEAVKRSILHNRAKFRKDRSNRCGDIACSVIFQDGGRHHLGFSKIRNFNGVSRVVANLHHRAKFHHNRSIGYGEMAI